MSPLLPVVNKEVIHSIAIERERKGTAAYMFDIWQRMTRSNSYLSGHITGYLVGSLDTGTLPARSEEDIARQFQQGTELAKALSGVCLLYRLLESQAEADRMNEDLKLE